MRLSKETHGVIGWARRRRFDGRVALYLILGALCYAPVVPSQLRILREQVSFAADRDASFDGRRRHLLTPKYTSS